MLIHPSRIRCHIRYRGSFFIYWYPIHYCRPVIRDCLWQRAVTNVHYIYMVTNINSSHVDPNLSTHCLTNLARQAGVWLVCDGFCGFSADRGVEVRDALAIVKSDGNVLWYPHCVFRSACSIDVSNFPFDHQLCHLWFGSWTYSTAELDLQMAFPEGLDLSTFQVRRVTCQFCICFYD